MEILWKSHRNFMEILWQSGDEGGGRGGGGVSGGDGGSDVGGGGVLVNRR